MNSLPFILIGTGFLILAAAISGLLLLKETHPIKNDESISGQQANKFRIQESTLFKIYMFNVNNPHDILKGSNPTLTEIGPFTYELQKERNILRKTTENSSLEYSDKVIYKFRRELTLGNLKDDVTIINLPWVGIAQQTSTLSIISRLVVTAIVSRFNESIFMTREIEELLFRGYHEEVVATFASITGEDYLPNNTFGFFYGRNGSSNPIRVISTSEANYGETLKYDNMSELPYWSKLKQTDSKNCNKLTGVDWNIFPENLNKTYVEIFSPDMCRHIKLDFEKEIEYEGIRGYRFSLGRQELGIKCYCTEEEENECPLEGAYFIRACSKGASILLSQPHYYQGGEIYTKNTGLSPTKERHETFVDIEPLTGRVLRSSKRLQVNLHLKPLNTISEFRKVPNLLFPVIWTDETSTITSEALKDLKRELNLNSTPSSYQLLVFVIMALGVTLIVSGIFIFILQLRKKTLNSF